MLTGKHVGLRAIEESDLPQLLSWRNNPTYRKYFREYRELSSTHQYKWFQSITSVHADSLMFAIVELETNRLMGATGLCYLNWKNRSADFSIYVGCDDLYIDSRFAADAGNVLLQYGFSELGLHRVWAEIYDYDDAKIKMLTALGFALDGRHRETLWRDGKWHDSLFYGILDKDYFRWADKISPAK